MKKVSGVGQSQRNHCPRKRFIALPKRDVSMHAACYRRRVVLGMCDGFVVPLGQPHDVFVIPHVVGHLFHRSETNVDLSLTRGYPRDAGARR